MDRATRIVTVAVLGVIGAACSSAPVPSLALAGASLLLLGVPCWATAHALVGGDPEADRADQLAAAFGGVAVSVASLWIIGATIGLSPYALRVAPIAASVLVTLSAPDGGIARRALPAGFARLAALAIGFAALVLVPFYPHGIERPDGVHHMGLSDWYLHLMMTTTLDTAPSLPPSNPYLLAHGQAYYHYGFHLLAAAIHRAAGRPVDVFPILLGLTAMTAAAYPLVVFTLSRRLLRGDAGKALLAAALATLLAGFDIVVWASFALDTALARWPIALDASGLRLLIPSAHLHSWIPVYERQFNAPYVALLWAPHYVAAVLVVLLAIHALRNEVARAPRVAVACMMAALPGLSAYVLLAAVVAVAAIVAADVLVSGAPWRSAALRRWASAGILAGALAGPILWTLRASVGQHVAPLFMHLSAVGTLRNGAIFTHLYGDAQRWRALDTPMLLVFQLGVVGLFGALGILHRVRRGRLGDVGLAHAAAAIAVAAVLVVFRPPVGMDNNVGLRPMLIAWSLLAGFAAEAWSEPARIPGARWIALAICAAALPYGLLGATLEGYLFRPTSPALVAVAHWMNEQAPPGSPVAVDPEDHPRGFDLWLRQPLIEAEHRRNALMMGAPPEQYESVRRRLHEAYATSDGAAASARFEELGAQLVVARADAQGRLPWDPLPCFTVAYRAAELAVFRREPTCEPPAPADPSP